MVTSGAATTTAATGAGRGNRTRVLQVAYLYVALLAATHAVLVLSFRARVEELLDGEPGVVIWIGGPDLPLEPRLALVGAAVVVVATVLAVRTLPVPAVVASAALLVPLLGVVPPGPWATGRPVAGSSEVTAGGWAPYVEPLAADAAAIVVALLLVALVTVRRRTGERGSTRTTVLTAAALAAVTAMVVGTALLERLRWLL
ncbi:hypothetical protein ACOACO_05825 [Nocardioides sp. CPCC 205120]|uniref:hypothetical protein n=1 Tax=Nocardioides sp. CPCC 205120 TaxID=3406462 RepID=UPI003B51173C